MIGLSAWTTAVCLAAAVAAVVEMMTPEGKLGKSVQMVLGLFLLCAVVLPFANGLTIELPKTAQESGQEKRTALSLEEEVQRQYKSNMEEKIRGLIEEALRKEGFDAKKITVEMDTLSDGRIDIRQMAVLMDRKWITHEGRIQKSLEPLGLPVTITYE